MADVAAAGGRKEGIGMGNEETMVWLRLQERRDEMKDAARRRELAAGLSLARGQRRRSGLRRSVGLAMVRLGDRLAAEERDGSASADRTASVAG